MPPKRKAAALAIHSNASKAPSNKRSKQSRSSRNAPAKGESSVATFPQEEMPTAAESVDSKPSTPSENGASEPNFDHSRPEERYGIVQREFYPPQMSDERCQMYNNNEIPRPLEVLSSAIANTANERRKIQVGKCVVHWFKRDLRLYDNKALSMASKKAREADVPLLCMFLVSPQDYQAHLTSPARVDFELRTLSILQKDLAKLDIPLYTETVEERNNVPGRIISLARQWGAKHIFCNIEYEVDELRRETKLSKSCLRNMIDFTAVHDDTVVAPGELSTGQGKQYAVYTPWFRAWTTHLHRHPELLNAFEPPSKNPLTTRGEFSNLFDMQIPDAPPNKTLSEDERKRFSKLWPAGEHEARARLERFLRSKIKSYKNTRNFPAEGGTAMVSVHHSVGTLSPRTSVRMARDANTTKRLDSGNEGIRVWISEVAWRDFYKHVLAHWPYICMHKPFKYEYTNIEWEYNEEHFRRWCRGKTGFPIVDAAMRQLNHMAYMHNRCRMVVASFLAKDLLLDWRMGERYFMEHLIDGDFASNNGGWGFSASTGVDPQPYFRIFNPLLQSEKFDPEGEYIRKWVPELRDVDGKAIHDPYDRGAGDVARRNGYPKPIVDHKFCRDRALSRYKAGIGRDTA